MPLYRPLVATDSRDIDAYPLDFESIHKRGIPHRAVQIEIINDEENFFIWQRPDGRLEILGGHVEWLQDQNWPESYEEAAIREVIEELNLLENWQMSHDTIYEHIKKRLTPITRLINQIPSSHGYNNEWVTVFSLSWQKEWGEPCDPVWSLSLEGKLPWWATIEEIEKRSLEIPMGINAALRLFLQRRNILIPITARSTSSSSLAS